MTTYVCSNCGEHNAPGTTFCVNCHAFLAWDEVASEDDGVGSQSTVIPARTDTGSRQRRQPDEHDDGTVIRSAVSQPPDAEPTDGTDGGLQISAEQSSVTVPATGELATLTVRVMNTSTIVDGYGIEAPEAPPWLIVESAPIDLLPGSEDALAVRMRVKRIESGKLVRAQKIEARLRVHSKTHDGVRQDLPIQVIVPIDDLPVQLRAEPRLIRTKDTDSSHCTVEVNNPSNTPKQIRFSGSDAEQAVKFDFKPPTVDVEDGGQASVVLNLTATQPEPGKELTRQLTITANDGERSVETVATLQQATSVRVEDPPVALEAVPSLVRVRDNTTGWARIVADNRGGTHWAHLELKASDPEQVVRVAWSGPELHVPPGRTASTEVQFDAPLPDAGTEASRVITVSAANGHRTSTATVTFLQVTSASPMTTLAVRLEPSVVRVRDADNAPVQVLIDNQRGGTGVRVFLSGSDPEQAVRFTFSAPVVDVAAGQVQVVGLRLDSWRPPPGQEWTRQLTVTASDGKTSVDGTGSLLHASSRAAIELLGVRLDPTVLRLANRSEGRLAAIIDNRNGAQPIRVSLRGDDPENVVRFRFTPAVLEIPPGKVASSAVRLRAPRPAGGTQLTRPFMIMATDGRSETEASGSLIQASSSRRPIARALFTLLGGLAMILGAFLPWRAVSDQLGVQIDASQVVGFFVNLEGLQINGTNLAVEVPLRLISFGLGVAVLGVLVIFGLTGRSGRLSRLGAMLGALIVVAVLVAFAITGNGGAPGSGAILAVAGCVAGYIGGKLVKR